jgi:hypothetical protein
MAASTADWLTAIGTVGATALALALAIGAAVAFLLLVISLLLRRPHKVDRLKAHHNARA